MGDFSQFSPFDVSSIDRRAYGKNRNGYPFARTKGNKRGGKREEEKRGIFFTGAFLRVPVGDLAQNDWLTSTFGIHRVHGYVHPRLDGRLQSREGEARLVGVRNVIEGLAARQEIHVAVVHLQDEFLRKPSIVASHAFHLDAGVSLVRERAVTDRKWFS